MLQPVQITLLAAEAMIYLLQSWQLSATALQWLEQRRNHLPDTPESLQRFITDTATDYHMIIICHADRSK